MLWDVFISHASEDKAEVVRPLANLLHEMGLRVWLDEQQISLGDSLSRRINDGLAMSRFGVLILSKSFLANDYPQRELQALLARQTADERYILPILHKIDHSLLLRRLPLLSDLLSITTDAGLYSVADAIRRAVEGTPPVTTRANTARYFESFEFPEILIHNAMSAIALLSQPDTWPYLIPIRDMAAEDVWMGTDAPEFISLLYHIYCPIVHFFKKRYQIERTLTTLRSTDQVRFVLLDAALDALTKDCSIAAAAPRLQYTPRVEGWRVLRRRDPARYWWQGLTRKRLEAVVPVFYSATDLDESPSMDCFTSSYNVGFRAFCSGQQTLGLLANPLYHFTPKTRPVYWRMLAIWQCLYGAILGINREASPSQLHRLLLESPWVEGLFPRFSCSLSFLPEAPEQTRNAIQTYLNIYAIPRVREFLG
jgi:hypothetical protein